MTKIKITVFSALILSYKCGNDIIYSVIIKGTRSHKNEKRKSNAQYAA